VKKIRDAFVFIGLKIQEFGTMKQSKIFLGVAILFVIFLAIVIYDISHKTIFPGSKSQVKEKIRKDFLKKDTMRQSPKK